jgi:Glycosyl hydrolases family 38 C-terminal domain/Glycosyl hydrolases family 38 C-terminal beta sandwich domain
MTVRDASGKLLPSQLIANESVPANWERDRQDNLVMADVAFVASEVPSAGYNTYYLDFSPGASNPAETDLKVAPDDFQMENQYLKVRLSPAQGNIISLIDKLSGHEMLNGSASPFPVFRGRANPNYPAPRGPFYSGAHPATSTIGEVVFESTAATPATIRWVEKGPVRATLKTRFEWPLLSFETDVRLSARSRWVEVVSRILTTVPPAVDRVENGRFPLEIKEGYWIDFAPNLAPKQILRDYAFAIEATAKSAFHALTLVDLEGAEGGLLVLHAGTQYFKVNDVGEGIFSNLLMREWESYFSDEYGWPRYAEYHHALMPHGLDFSNGQRLQASRGFTQNLFTLVCDPHSGSLSPRKSFFSLAPESVQLSACRTKPDGETEIRVVNYGDQAADTTLRTGFPVNGARETNLLGRKIRDVACESNRLAFKLEPWKIGTFELV